MSKYDDASADDDGDVGRGGLTRESSSSCLSWRVSAFFCRYISDTVGAN